MTTIDTTDTAGTTDGLPTEGAVEAEQIVAELDELDELDDLDDELTAISDEVDEDDELVLELVVLDLAGTTVSDDGIVEEAFRIAAAAIGLDDSDADGFDDEDGFDDSALDDADDADAGDADADAEDADDADAGDDSSDLADTDDAIDERDERDEDEDDETDDDETDGDDFSDATPTRIDEALDYVRRTMGQSKIDVFRVLTGGDEERAQAGNVAFEEAYASLIAAGRVEEIPGASDTIRLLRELGVTVVLTTGFAPATRDALLESLGWTDIADLVLSPSDAGRGRPAPDLPLTALIRTGASSVDTMVVVGDTASDMLSGLNAGAGLVVGVLTGAHDESVLLEAGADDVIASIADLPALLGLD
ncbi:HAD family hydrolase [Plantibacter sp. YIM 135347]|uniref:HAD family hydrolase n=1 Tax=Plantibacter sp. YIM 135347 TaxID=3423919 RepID=UPI003D356941